MLFVTLVVGVIAYAFMYLFFIGVGAAYGPYAMAGVIALALISVMAPVVSSLVIGDRYGTVANLYVPVILAFLPMWNLIWAYGLARFSDITWGNRPHESESRDGARRDAFMNKSHALGAWIIVLYLLSNVACAALLVAADRFWGSVNLGLTIYLSLVAPFALSCVGGLQYNIQYALKYKYR